ncbi:MAG: hypothetical protein QI199_03370, partial [Candidatus Korarchaeota archaeon]|nr:hypothetical protein [Candidatus Korarchaeota archaeon]
MRAATLLLAFSLGLLLSGLLVAAIKPRASVDREHGAYHVPGAKALIYLLSPGASYSRMAVKVSCSGDARVVLAAVSVEHLAKG